MTLIVMIDADFSWIIRVYHNHLRHLRSIIFVVYFLRVTLAVVDLMSRAWPAPTGSNAPARERCRLISSGYYTAIKSIVVPAGIAGMTSLGDR